MVETNEATRAWLERIMATAEEVILVDEEDNEVGRALAYDFTTDRMMETLKYIFRGLYWNATGVPLPADTPVEATLIPWSIFPDFMRTMGVHRRGDPTVKGNLAAWWSELGPVADVGTESTAWVLCVNDGVGVFGTTGQLAVAEQKRKVAIAMGEEKREGPRRVRVPRDSNGRLMIPPQ